MDQHQHVDSSYPCDVQSAQGESFASRGIPNNQNCTRDDINQASPEHFSVEINKNVVDNGSKRKLTSAVRQHFERKSINGKIRQFVWVVKEFLLVELRILLHI